MFAKSKWRFNWERKKPQIQYVPGLNSEEEWSASSLFHLQKVEEVNGEPKGLEEAGGVGLGREACSENLREGLLTFALSGARGDPKLCHVPCCSWSGGGGLGPELWGIFLLGHSQPLAWFMPTTGGKWPSLRLTLRKSLNQILRDKERALPQLKFSLLNIKRPDAYIGEMYQLLKIIGMQILDSEEFCAT